MRITTRKREERRLETIVRDLERLADAEDKQNKELARWIDLACVNHNTGRRAGARQVLARYKND